MPAPKAHRLHLVVAREMAEAAVVLVVEVAQVKVLVAAALASAMKSMAVAGGREETPTAAQGATLAVNLGANPVAAPEMGSELVADRQRVSTS